MKPSLFLLLVLLAPVFSVAQVQVTALRVNQLVAPMGLDEAPRFSWQLSSARRSVRQSGCEIEVVLGKKSIWKSGTLATSESHLLAYGGPALQSDSRYQWRVRVRDDQNAWSPWSEWASFHTGLLQPGDWQAAWIGPGYEEPASRPSPLLRKAFRLKGKIQSATLFVTAQGLYEAHLNGQRVGDAWFTPGWTSYSKRIQYQAFDVTSLLTPGDNALGVMLGSGWFRGYLGWEDQKDNYGNSLGLLAQLEIVYADVTRSRVVSDGSWTSSTGEILSSEIYHGEHIDARRQQPGWTMPGFRETNWQPVALLATPAARIVGTDNGLIRRRETFRPQSIIHTASGKTIFDFGQNLVGYVEVTAKGQPGDSIVLRHVEVLDKNGEPYFESLRSARQKNVYVLAGTGKPETFHPHFSWQGFRYVVVESYPGMLNEEAFKAVALYSDMPLTGDFSCSDSLVNRLQQNIQWGQRGNFLDVPTDCPQRDERMGWTGDAQVFARTAAFNFDVAAFFGKWLEDVALDQRPDGAVPFVVPNVLGEQAAGSTGWGEAATVIPWTMYLAYGDKQVLEKQYASMAAWVDFMTGKSQNDLWNTGFHFGDWLFYSVNDDRMGTSAITDRAYIAQCFWAASTDIVAKSARLLGKNEDAARYEQLARRIREAFVKEYLTPNGATVSNTQTSYVLALQFDMVPEAMRPAMAQRLVNNIRSYENHLTTGFLGTPYLCHVLSRFGHTDVAYDLLMQKTYPSWLYPVTMGATTIWERWDGMKTDSTFQNPGMNSFNHYAYGAVGDWLYRVVAGIDTDEQQTGYRSIRFEPRPGGGLTRAEASLQSPYGLISSGWVIENGRFTLTLRVPPNTTAGLVLPPQAGSDVTESGLPLSQATGIKATGPGQYQLASGVYRFSTSWTPNP